NEGQVPTCEEEAGVRPPVRAGTAHRRRGQRRLERDSGNLPTVLPEAHVLTGVEKDQDTGADNSDNYRPDGNPNGVGGSEPGPLPFLAAVVIRDRREDYEQNRRYYDPREGGVHVQKQLLQVEEVPGCLGRVWRDVRVGTVDQGSINQGREDREAEGERGRGDELEEDDVGPDENLFCVLGAMADLRRRYGIDR